MTIVLALVVRTLEVKEAWDEWDAKQCNSNKKKDTVWGDRLYQCLARSGNPPAKDPANHYSHRATSQSVAALLSVGPDEPKEHRDRAWACAGPLLLDVINDKLTPENLDAGWHFREEKPILNDILARINHPYNAVPDSIRRVLATIYRARYYKSFLNVAALFENKAISSVGIRPYKATSAFMETVTEVFQRIKAWRHERVPVQQEQSSYTARPKTVLTWLDWMLSSQECTELVQFFPEPFIGQLPHMMDVREDPELMRLAHHVYRQLPNIPLHEGEDRAFITQARDLAFELSLWQSYPGALRKAGPGKYNVPEWGHALSHHMAALPAFTPPVAAYSLGPMLRAVRFRHPAYPDSAPDLLVLMAVDDGNGGLDFDLALAACCIIAGVNWDGGYLALKASESNDL
ncbi:proteasome activator subunit [Ophiostoma piceae UAMH 11346]|uniref:Proteasome activator subunit n=1 Tax=Ophiostoma piceae (strain UAMH 11346) TaxID=1262450 RepID=S3BSW3_OPHP1|nr:proteasome activator subunit [Ophiostoma piceae UAMH 11346]